MKVALDDSEKVTGITSIQVKGRMGRIFRCQEMISLQEYLKECGNGTE